MEDRVRDDPLILLEVQCFPKKHELIVEGGCISNCLLCEKKYH